MADNGLFGVSWTVIIEIVIVAAVAITMERLITRYLSRFARRAKLERSTANNLTLTFRVLILLGAVLAISRISGVQPEIILSASAIGGAAVGFASQRTIGNFVAGLFLLAARPFKVGDYVRVGNVEGVVQEVTLNYTKILTIGKNVVSMSNLQVLDRDITNFLYESSEEGDTYCYTFEIGLSHELSAEKTAKIFEDVFARIDHPMPMQPHYMVARSSGTERVYTVYFYVERPEVIFDLRRQITEEVFKRWDNERKALTTQA